MSDLKGDEQVTMSQDGSSPARNLTVFHVSGNAWNDLRHKVVTEEPLQIRAQGRCLARLLRVPGEDEHLALGWCLSSGLISGRDDVHALEVCAEAGRSSVEVVFAPECGSAQSLEIFRNREAADELPGAGVPQVRTGHAVQPEALLRARQILEAGQKLYQETGGTHCAALFAEDLELMALAEDVGRHNALDKVVGRTLGRGLERALVLVLSSRLNGEMVSKAVQAGIPLVAGFSAPTLRGVHIAREAGLTLAGFLRPGSFNVYTHPWRIEGLAEGTSSAAPWTEPKF